MRDITILNNQEVLGKSFSVYGDIDNPLFLAKDVAEMIGHNQVARMIELVDEDEKLKCLVSTSGQARVAWFLTEYGLYEVLMQSRKPIAKEFKKEVKAILKDLRRTGVVITESATEEAIDYQSKYGRYRIRRTFRETTDLIGTWEEFKRLSKIERQARRINNDVRIKGCDAIIDELKCYIAYNVSQMRPSQVIMYQEIIQEIYAEKNRLTNKYYGGLLSAQTKQIKRLEQQIEQEEEPQLDDYFFIDSHAFSCNFMYSYSNYGIVKSAAYQRWINNLHLEKYLPEEIDVDFTKPIRIDLLYGSKEGMDITNFNKAIIDQVATYYGFDDSLVNECNESLLEHVDSYDDGFIYIKIENI